MSYGILKICNICVFDHKKATPIRLKEWHTKYELCKFNKKTPAFYTGEHMKRQQQLFRAIL